MKIGIYSPYLDTLTGGEKYIFTMASCLQKEHDVAIFWDSPEIIEKASTKFRLDLSKVKVLPNIFVNTGKFTRFLKTLSYDRIIFLSDGSFPIVGAKKLFLHFQFPAEWINAEGIGVRIKKRFVSKFICNSYYTKHYIDRKFNVESFTLYPPADINLNKITAKENVILTVGRFNRLSNGTDFKKLEVMVDAFKKFQKKRLKGWIFKIITSVNVAEENEFEKFERKIKNSSIKVYKNLSYNEIIKVYAEAKIYWHAAGFGEDLEKNPERTEHFGISTVEAMSYGAVPVVINAGGQKEIVKNNESGYLWETINEMLAITHKLAVNHNLREKIAESAIDASRNFSRERFCEELNHLIW